MTHASDEYKHAVPPCIYINQVSALIPRFSSNEFKKFQHINYFLSLLLYINRENSFLIIE